MLELLPKITANLTEEKLPLLASFFQRAQVLIWSRFKAIMEARRLPRRRRAQIRAGDVDPALHCPALRGADRQPSP